MNKTCLRLLILACLCFACSVLDVQAANAQKPIRPYEIRYTSGRVTNAGWEKVLVEDDPNLKHWNWSAMSDYTQSYKRVAPGSYKQARPQSGVYSKPVHLSPLIYAKPREETGPIVVGDKATIRIRGQAVLPPPNKPSSEQAAPVLSYGSYLRNAEAETNGEFSSASKVQGRLIKKKSP